MLKLSECNQLDFSRFIIH